MADQHNSNIPAMGNTIAADIQDIKENLEYHKDAFQAFVNSWSDTTATNIKPKIVGDADNDTLIQCEESADEDIIRFDIGGTEQVTIQDGKIEPTTDDDVDLGSSSKEFKDLYIDGTGYIDAVSADSITIASTGAFTRNSVAQGMDVTAAIHRKIVEIGDWNMDSTASVAVDHGVTLSKIRRVSVFIRNDNDDALYPLDYTRVDSGTTEAWGYFYVYTTYVSCIRVDGTYGGLFDSANYDSTSFNRGWVIIEYVD